MNKLVAVMIGLGLMLGTISFAQETTGGPKMAQKKAKKAKKSKTKADPAKK